MKNDKSAKAFGPLEAQWSAEELHDEIHDRLKLLMENSGAEASPDGWRKLAMYLISRLPEFKFRRQPGDESTMHLPLMHIERLIRTNYPVFEMAQDKARQLRLSDADTDILIKARLAEAPKLSIERAVRIEVGVDGKKEETWTDAQMRRVETLMREYRKHRREKKEDALFTSSIRRRAHESLRAWYAIEDEFSQLEIRWKAKDGAVNKDDFDPNDD